MTEQELNEIKTYYDNIELKYQMDNPDFVDPDDGAELTDQGIDHQD